ncbi:hypothetical protein CkaCkLH20_07672 [Colletotrichum karsti]|uniref:2EXR domain-containing protein n=1 Tax=Colletotrichum karsti TaxID=1095194 RepID=A0A9P6LIT6_9PEZI|nr:uncharacterized protein CkaCkLH20_07672 [Colletotrichum karsti]KAF9874978.1 hypothetical protein CkaCkLH20_07672 [Colletotrichum karsti]
MDVQLLRSTGPAGTFHEFSALPPEIQVMIWEEFYLEPRYFVPWAHRSCNLIGAGFKITVNMYVACSSSLHYQGIDTQINRMSYHVARRLRRPFRFPTMYWEDMRVEQSAGGVADARLNWDTDIICFIGHHPDSELGPHWSHNIQNLVVGRSGGQTAETGCWLVADLSPLDKRAKIERIRNNRIPSDFFYDSPELTKHLRHWAYVQVLNQSPRIYPEWWEEWHGRRVPPGGKTQYWNGNDWFSHIHRGSHGRYKYTDSSQGRQGSLIDEWCIWPQFARLSQDGTTSEMMEASPRVYVLSEGELRA